MFVKNFIARYTDLWGTDKFYRYPANFTLFSCTFHRPARPQSWD